jgi:hypothetical protein
MTTPTVTETSIALEPVTRDDFADSLPSARELERPTQRDLVILASRSTLARLTEPNKLPGFFS